MASYTKSASGIRASVYVKGVRKTKSFPNKRDAKEWADKEEANLRSSVSEPAGTKFTLRQALEKYRDEVCTRNRGAAWEQVRIEAFLNRPDWLPLDRYISLVTTEDFAKFQVERKKTVKDGTILRELGLLSAVMEAVRKQWKWIQVNPVHDVNKPSEPAPRERLITRREIKLMLRGMNYSPKSKHIGSIMESVGVCFMLALRTGMRAGDLTNLDWVDVHPRHVLVKMDKSGKPRIVPLSLKAVRLIKKMKGFDPISVFGVAANSRDAMFRKIRNRQKLSGFTFHDSRHTSATWIAGSFKSNKDVTAQQAVFDLCKIFGWSDPKRALVYFNPNPEDLASRLD